uniref:Uncharacterized protein n=1 Tax=Eubacterium plexicaudatum ASF492 TaxID=1235802 RepID=N2A5C6_9FIRM
MVYQLTEPVRYNHLWKKRNKQRISNQILLRFDISAVYVNQVSKRLKRVKRNSYRKYKIKRLLHGRNSDFFQHKVQIGNQKIKIFKKQQQPQIQ